MIGNCDYAVCVKVIVLCRAFSDEFVLIKKGFLVSKSIGSESKISIII